jgi:hypothetical protein
MNLLLGWRMGPAHERFDMFTQTNAPQFHPGIV